MVSIYTFECFQGRGGPDDFWNIFPDVDKLVLEAHPDCFDSRERWLHSVASPRFVVVARILKFDALLQKWEFI